MRDVKFIIATSKNPEPNLQKFTPFTIKPLIQNILQPFKLWLHKSYAEGILTEHLTKNFIFVKQVLNKIINDIQQH